MPVGQRNTAISNGHTIAVQRTSSCSASRAQAGLHEVPVAEQHRVGHRAEERRAHEQPRRGERVPGRPRTPTPRSNARRTEDRRDEVERGRELGQALAFAASRRRSLPTIAATRARRVGA